MDSGDGAKQLAVDDLRPLVTLSPTHRWSRRDRRPISGNPAAKPRRRRAQLCDPKGSSGRLYGRRARGSSVQQLVDYAGGRKRPRSPISSPHPKRHERHWKRRTSSPTTGSLSSNTRRSATSTLTASVRRAGLCRVAVSRRGSSKSGGPGGTPPSASTSPATLPVRPRRRRSPLGEDDRRCRTYRFRLTRIHNPSRCRQTRSCSSVARRSSNVSAHSPARAGPPPGRAQVERHTRRASQV